MQVDALAMKSALVHVLKEEHAESAQEINDFSDHANIIGELEFKAFMGMLGQTDTGYRH